MNIPKEPEILVAESRSNIKKHSNIIIRSLSGIVIIALFYSSLIYNKPSFNILISVIGLLMLYEWFKMVRYSFSYLFLGILIISPAIYSLIFLNINNFKLSILTFFILIWTVDTFAMIGGKTIKGPKLAPYLSPNKRWSGLIVGVVASTLITLLFIDIFEKNFDGTIKLLFKKPNIYSIILLGTVAQMSDLFISFFKRKFGIKDSGSIIPGHGGMLDRFDSIILTAPMLLFMVYYQ